MKKRVVVTGLGIVSSIGIGINCFWNNLVKGVSGISKVSAFDTSGHTVSFGGEAKGFLPQDFLDKRSLRFLSRGAQLVTAATKMALEDSKLSSQKIKNNDVAFCLGTTLGELPALESMDRKWVKDGPLSLSKLNAFQFPTTNMASYVSQVLKIRGPLRIFATACSAGNYSTGFGFDLIRRGDVEISLTGGGDAFAWIPFTGFNRLFAMAPQKCQPFDKNRKGMLLGEGAGMLVLESLDHALARDAYIYAEVLGYGVSCDAVHVTRTNAEGVFNCMKNALDNSGVSAGDIDYISAHGTGTKQNDLVESQAIHRLFQDQGSSIPVSSIKSMLGHTMGAASAIEAIACCKVVEKDVIPPTINFETADPECNIDCVPNLHRVQEVNMALNNGFAFGGNNASLVIKKFRK